MFYLFTAKSKILKVFHQSSFFSSKRLPKFGFGHSESFAREINERILRSEKESFCSSPATRLLIQLASFSGWCCWFCCLTSWFFEQKRDDLVFPSFWVLVWLVSVSNSSASVDNEVGKVPLDRLILSWLGGFHPFVKWNLVFPVDSWNLAHHVKSNSVLFLKIGWVKCSKSLDSEVRIKPTRLTLSFEKYI